MREGAARGLLLGAEHVLDESSRQVPLDEATLQRSGTVSVDEGTLTAAISYDQPYAVRQHEDLSLNHPMPGRNAKYLERPLIAEAGTVGEIIAAETRRSLQ
ncbi:minor capsid protein [Yinghuangia sp. KLBMP8922]|uniref:Minor capsid protein n=2 Tax=Yinghuangia soli TaxID=2908204 RepID=A0AA41U797_9ACTN|nr:minor capsid protein [Yinghuangia soli]MCF2531749.1 minor capsid protein [Yinghuangia soli]